MVLFYSGFKSYSYLILPVEGLRFCGKLCEQWQPALQKVFLGYGEDSIWKPLT